MDDTELQSTVKSFCQYVTVLTGCHIETAATLVTLKVIKNFLQSQWPFLTAKELQTAFELNCTGQHWPIVQHYNRQLNCDYIGQVLVAYNENYRRRIVPIIVQTQNDAIRLLSQPKPKQDVTDKDRQQILQMAYETYLRNPNMPLYGIRTLHGYCVRFGLIDEQEHVARTGSALGKLRAAVSGEIENAKRQKQYGMQVEMERQLENLKKDPLPASTAEVLEECAMELCVKAYFKNTAEQKIETIFAAGN